MKEKRNNISNRKEQDEFLFYKLINSIEYKKANTIAFYLSFNNEVDTKKLIEYSLSIKKEVVIPKINTDDNLEFYIFNNNYLSLTKNKYGILEPNESMTKIDDNKINLIIVPGLAFDSKKYRLGYGKGYYDRYLQKNHIESIGLFYKEQYVENLPIEPFDISLNHIFVKF